MKTLDRLFLEQMSSQRYSNVVYVSVMMTCNEGEVQDTPYLVEVTASLTERKLGGASNTLQYMQPIKKSKDALIEERRKAERTLDELRAYRDRQVKKRLLSGYRLRAQLAKRSSQVSEADVQDMTDRLKILQSDKLFDTVNF